MEPTPCKHLRSKRLFIPDLATDAFAQSGDFDVVSQCWCNHSMREVGLDERHVSFKACTRPERPCYEPA